MKDLDRDESVGRLLGRSLRTRANANPLDACPDAETLAAWSDDALTPSERTSIDTHVADCARCQAHLAAMVRITPDAPVVSERSTFQLWRWLVPAAAVATAVALWVWVEPARMPSLREQTAPMQTAAPPPPAAAAPMEAREKAAVPEALNDREARKVDGNAIGRGRSSSFDSARTAEQPVAAPLESRPLPNARENTAPRDESRAIDSLTAQQRKPEQDLAKKAEGARGLSRQEAASADARRDRAFSTAPAAAAAAPSVLARSAIDLRFDITSPDPAVRWRVNGSTVQRSTDGGTTWETQSTGVDARFTAGASPAPLVCWLVGRSGIVLLSTDGRTWRRVPFPETVDLIGVTASSATSASVTTADGRTLTTSDGGTTWR